MSVRAFVGSGIHDRTDVLSSTVHDGTLCRAPLPHELLVPRRGVGRPTSSSSGQSSLACPAWPSPTTRASTASSGSRRRQRRPGSTRSSGSRSSCSTRSFRIRTGSSFPPGDRRGVAADGGRHRRPADGSGSNAVEGLPDRPRPERARLPGHREPVKEDHRGIGERQRGPHLVLLARDATGYRSLCRLISRANLAGTKAVPRFSHELLAEHAEGLVALSGCREGEIARRLLVGDREGARAAAAALAARFPGGVLPRAVAPPPAGRRLARGGDGGSRRRARAAGRRDERRPLRPAGGPRVPGRADGDPPRPDARRAGGPAAARRRVVPEVGGGDGGAAAGRRVARPIAHARAWAGGDRQRRASWRRPARSISGSSSTASRASRCRTARPRSRISSSCARPAPGSAITR